MSFWEIQVEDGARQDVNDLAVGGKFLKMGSLIEDQLRITQVFENAAASSAALPDLAEVTLWRDGSRYFKGHVTNKRTNDTSTSGLQVVTTISGVWWWLKQTPLSGIAQGRNEGNTAERHVYAFPEGDLRTTVINILERAKELGVPIEVGTIAEMFPCPEITLKQISCADALAEVLMFTADAMCRVDYSGAGNPTFNVQRRPTAAVNTLTVGQLPCTSIALNPRIELETTQVSVSYLERDVTGAAVMRVFQAGEADDSAAVGKRQINIVSGPELDTYLPPDLVENYEMETRNLTDIRALVNAYVPGVTEALAAGMPAEAMGLGAVSWAHYKQIPGGEREYANTSGHTVSITGGGNAADYHLILGDNPPSWVTEEHDVREVEITGTWWYLHYLRELTDPASSNAPEPAWMSELQGGILTYGWETSSGGSLHHFYTGEYSIKGYAVATEYAAATTIYREADYKYLQPPEGFAEGLLSTQNFVPYEGTVTVAHEEAGEVDYLGRCLNINGSLAEHANMKALVQAVEMELETGETSIQLGVPQRLSYLGLVNRFRRSGSDNIRWLDRTNGGGGSGGGVSGSGFSSGGISLPTPPEPEPEGMVLVKATRSSQSPVSGTALTPTVVVSYFDGAQAIVERIWTASDSSERMQLYGINSPEVTVALQQQTEGYFMVTYYWHDAVDDVPPNPDIRYDVREVVVAGGVEVSVQDPYNQRYHPGGPYQLSYHLFDATNGNIVRQAFAERSLYIRSLGEHHPNIEHAGIEIASELGA